MAGTHGGGGLVGGVVWWGGGGGGGGGGAGWVGTWVRVGCELGRVPVRPAGWSLTATSMPAWPREPQIARRSVALPLGVKSRLKVTVHGAGVMDLPSMRPHWA